MLLRSKGVVMSDPGKVALLGRQVSVEKMSESKPSDDASLINQGLSKLGSITCSRNSRDDTCLRS